MTNDNREPEGKPRVSAWPRLTKKQRELLLEIERAKYGDLHIGSRYRRTADALAYKHMAEHYSGGWYHLTQSGKDYLRFGMRRKTQ